MNASRNKNFERLQENVKLNGLDDKILQINCALSDSKADLTFELSDSNCGDHRVRTSDGASDIQDIFNESKRPVITVRGNTLDDLLAGLPEKFTDDFSGDVD